jgi:hypothetical protein
LRIEEVPGLRALFALQIFKATVFQPDATKTGAPFNGGKNFWEKQMPDKPIFKPDVMYPQHPRFDEFLEKLRDVRARDQVTRYAAAVTREDVTQYAAAILAEMGGLDVEASLARLRGTRILCLQTGALLILWNSYRRMIDMRQKKLMRPWNPRWHIFGKKLCAAVHDPCACDHTYRHASAILNEMGCDVEASLRNFGWKHGAYCDCGIILNMVLPLRDNPEREQSGDDGSVPLDDTF